MTILEIENLCKTYPAFRLDRVSFNLEAGKITGFIGRNGAGKTTTLKSLLNLVHPDGGSIRFFGREFQDNEFEIKQRVGFLMGGVDYYPKKKLKTITAVTKSFYREWDEGAYSRYLAMFQLDENKSPSQLSAGMRVKYALALALSHRAELLILDEPTSGLDPVSRDDLLDVFMDLCRQGVTILFSTHITSDLDKCADNIIYIKNGRIIAAEDMADFVAGYCLTELGEDQLRPELEQKLIGAKRSKRGYTALAKKADGQFLTEAGLTLAEADLGGIMIHLEKEDMEQEDQI